MRRPGRTRVALRWTIHWALLLGLWIALTDTVDLQELIAGAIVAAAGASFATSIVRRETWPQPGLGRAASGRARLRQILAPLPRLPADTLALARAVWRRIRHGRPLAGSLRTERLEGDPVLAEWWGSLAPSRYVIGVDEDAGTVLLHELPADESGTGE